MDEQLHPTVSMDVISHPYHDFNGGLAKAPLEFGHG